MFGENEVHITILGLGPSVEDYSNHVKRLGGRSAYCDEVWGINGIGNVFECDKIFHMDDMRIQEARAKAAPNGNIANMARWIKDTDIPVFTSVADPRYKSHVNFPLQEVVRELGEAYFNSTAAYAVAYAIYVGATRISLFGCDFSYANSHSAERGRACVEFWIAIAKQRGIAITLPRNTSLMDAYDGEQALFYGYDGFHVTIGDGLEISMEPKELPTVREIEHRYDHTRPTNALAEKGVT